MRDKKSGAVLSGGLGTGYVSIIMIFVVIVLTVLAALSYSAVGTNSTQNERAHENMRAYYAADAEANRKLMMLDEAALLAVSEGFFAQFELDASAIDGVTVGKSQEGYAVSWSETVSERIMLSCGITFFEKPSQHDGKRYEITKWETVSGGEADTHINVWDGSF